MSLLRYKNNTTLCTYPGAIYSVTFGTVRHRAAVCDRMRMPTRRSLRQKKKRVHGCLSMHYKPQCPSTSVLDRAASALVCAVTARVVAARTRDNPTQDKETSETRRTFLTANERNRDMRKSTRWVPCPFLGSSQLLVTRYR